MKSTVNKFFIGLVLPQQLVTYLIGLPLALYIVIFCGNFSGDRLLYLFIGVIVAGNCVTPLEIYLNYRRLKPHLQAFYDDMSMPDELQRAKIAFLKEPQKAGFAIMMSWLIAVAIATIVTLIIISLDTIHFITLAVVVLVTMPSGYVYTYFIAERKLADLLKSPKLSSITVTEYPVFSLWRKVAMTLSVLMWYPLAVLSLIIYEINYDIIQFTNVEYHILAIMALMLIILFYLILLLARSLKTTLGITVLNIEELSRGRLTDLVPLVTIDEIGRMAIYLNTFISELNAIIKKINEEAVILDRDSGKMSNDIIALSDSSREVASSVEELSASFEELSAASESIAKNSRDQKSQTDYAFQYYADLNNAIVEISSKATSALSVSDTAVQKAVRGGDVLRETVLKVQAIKRSAESIHESVYIIKDIADRVNLLSLNASIEAARAGEFGRGFSVVAQEIAKLAESTQINANEITKLIEGTIHQVNEGIESMGKTSDSFTEIKNYVDETSNVMQRITEETENQSRINREIKDKFNAMINLTAENLKATEEQSHAHQEFVQTLTRISSAVQNIAESTNSVGEHSRKLEWQSDMLSQNIAFFKIRK